MNARARALMRGMAAALPLLGTAGCQTMKAVSETVAVVGVATGAVTEEQAQSIVRTGEALGSAMEQLTPENEYWIGRAVTATILSRYPPLDRPNLNRYVNLVGQTLALFSDRPETFGGYHFLVLDSEEINAFAGPGGLITVTRGMLRLCRTEDELAAVLAHEIGHVQHRHGLQAIKKSRWTGAFTTIVVEAGKTLGGADLAEAVRAFEGSISDVTQTLVNSGYGRAAEREADAAAVRILRAAGYDPHALVTMLDEMKRRLRPGGLDFAKTHPDPADRIRDVLKLIGEARGTTTTPAERQRRFAAAIAEL
ncbi:MAG: M48 family metalloprotease [Kiritimatiellae bacterium]|nr:M48 family metalloprotease [Kiritimatiellia bacterium]